MSKGISLKGAGAVNTDATITGAGTVPDPLSAVGVSPNQTAEQIVVPSGYNLVTTGMKILAGGSVKLDGDRARMKIV